MKSKYIPYIFLVLTILLFITYKSIFAQQWPTEAVKDNVKGAWIKPADLDNDHDPDLVVQNGDTLLFFENQNNKWTTHIIDSLFKNSLFSSLELVDLDNDGDMDILQLPSSENSTLAWNENILEKNQWKRHIIMENLGYSGNMMQSYGDIDNDNDLDIVISLIDSNRIVLIENAHSNTKWIQHTLAKSIGSAYWITLAHMNDDSFFDIVAGSYFDGSIVIYYSNFPDPTWTPYKIASLQGNALGQCRDIDNDGDLDVITHSNISNTLVWYENPSWTEHIIDEGLSGFNYGLTGDLDDDGDYDVIFGSEDYIGWCENTNGAINWQRHIVATFAGRYPQPTGLADLNGDNYKDITGYALSAEEEAGDTFWLANPLLTEITAANNETPDAFSLDPNYPNPFNPTTKISYQLPQTSEVELSIYNLLGQKVQTLVKSKQPAGYYTTTWDASGFPSGVYIYQIITAGGYEKSRKFILLK